MRAGLERAPPFPFRNWSNGKAERNLILSDLGLESLLSALESVSSWTRAIDEPRPLAT
jgi:hypothetical protein